jgi:uncharacterized membrane protein YkoI
MRRRGPPIPQTHFIRPMQGLILRMANSAAVAAINPALTGVSDLTGRFHNNDNIQQAGRSMSSRFRAVLFCLALAATIAPLKAAEADSDDHDSVRSAVERGEIRSLAEILDMVRGKLPGKVAGVEIEREGGRWRYEFRVVDGNGHLFDVLVDARTAKIEQVKEK